MPLLQSEPRAAHKLQAQVSFGPLTERQQHRSAFAGPGRHRRRVAGEALAGGRIMTTSTAWSMVATVSAQRQPVEGTKVSRSSTRPSSWAARMPRSATPTAAATYEPVREASATTASAKADDPPR
jgi:hypothetical protein